jgi:hypothetical protein
MRHDDVLVLVRYRLEQANEAPAGALPVQRKR